MVDRFRVGKHSGIDYFIADDDGSWVRYEDFAELAQLYNAAIELNHDAIWQLEMLQEEVDRLKKAGGSLVATFDLLQPGDVEFDLEMNAFRAALLEGREP